MSFQIGRALENGVTKTATRAGLTFVVLFGLVELFFLATTNTLVEAWIAGLDLPAGTMQPSMSPALSLPVSTAIAAVLAFVALLALQVLTIVLIRVMAGDRQVITRERYTRRMSWVVLNSIIGGIVIGVLTMIGFVILIIPGLTLSVSLLFTTVYLADQDEDFLTAMRNSWALASGNRWQIFGLYLIVLVAFFVVSVVVGLVLPSGTVLSLGVSTVINTVMVVYLIAVITDAYRQLRDGEGTGNGGEVSPNPATNLG